MCSYNTITCLLFVNSEQLQYMALDNVRIWAKCKCTFILTVLAFWIATRHIHSMSRFLYCNSKTERDRPHCVAIEVASSTTKQMKVLDLFFSDGYNTHIIIPKRWNSGGKFAQWNAISCGSQIVWFSPYSGQSAHRRVQGRDMNRKEERNAEYHQVTSTLG